MFSYLNAVVDMHKKQIDHMMDIVPESPLKAATVKFNKANFDLAYKTVEVTDGYLDSLKKVFAK
jgi:hypothetical protein